jgi:predicted RNA binding protein YcfA (HicA-like mRNA interferase family)
LGGAIGDGDHGVNMAKELIRKLRKHGAELIKGRGKGGHQLARYRGKQTTIPVHGDAKLGPQFIKKLCNAGYWWRAGRTSKVEKGFSAAANQGFSKAHDKARPSSCQCYLLFK